MARIGLSRITVGQEAPDFQAIDVHGKKIKLSLVDNHYILLVFFRYSGCPWCNLAIHRLTLEYPTLKENNCEVIAFVQSAKRDIESNIYDRHVIRPDFSIIADHERRFYDMYGVNNSVLAAARTITKLPIWIHSIRRQGYKQQSVDGNLFLVPASFLIDGRSHKVIKVIYGSSYYENEAFLDIYKSVFFKEL